MSANVTPPVFRQGSGRLCLDFVRTLRYRGTPDVTEELTGPGELAAWVAQCGPCGDVAVRAPSQQAVRDARALREAVYTLVTAARSPQGPSAASASARTRLNRAADFPVPTPRLTPDGGLVWVSAAPVAATLALVARDALDLATSPSLIARVHTCASPTCGALFLDHSRPGTRRWCSMDICGNRAKKAVLRARA
jgi:predicted RNA-binding Zn ribbon-like protein